jgi:GT2 family glycosyltransferase
MKIAIYTLTRDRLEYTKHCFKSLSKNAGRDYDHYVIDNGSTDGTAEWLKNQPTSDRGGCLFKAILLPENIGISAGSNMALDEILKSDYDIIIKMDNDCEVWTKNILDHVSLLVDAMRQAKMKMILSPRVEGINKQPNRVKTFEFLNYDIGVTGIVGGLFHIVPAEIYAQYRYPLELPKAWGQDDDFCEWARQRSIKKGYIENLVVNHYETTVGQAARFPEYFERKWKEEKV